MKYMLMMHTPRGTGDYGIGEWTAAAINAHIGFMNELNNNLLMSGELVGAEGLAPPGAAKVVRAGHNGAPAVTDGPFPETKEFLAGYWIVDVSSLDRVYDIAAKASSAPGPDGRPMGIPIEIREVMSAPATDG